MATMSIADRMKMYERAEATRRCMPLLPICARIDGRGFSRFTDGMRRPYDPALSEMMIEVTRYLVDETQAVVGYTQSDEITLIFYSPDHKSQIFFDGRIQKMTSILAAMTSVKFNAMLPSRFPEKVARLPVFDCRLWTVPTLGEAVNCLIWREQDAVRNSLSMAARAHYSHKQTMHKSGADLHDMLHEKGVNWNDYPAFFKRGTYVQRRKVVRRFTADELSRLPPKHAAHSDPELMVERNEVRILDLPPILQITNRLDVIFSGVEPETASGVGGG